MFKKAIILISVFVIGMLSSNLISHYASAEKELTLPEGNEYGGYEIQATDYMAKLFSGLQETKAVPSPKDRIPEKDILVNNERVLIDVNSAEWATFTDTHSMEPVLFAGSNAIEVKPQTEDDLQVGDIVAYESLYADGIIIHRIVHKAKDEKGTYFVLKGDNNPTSDPGRVRFSQISKVVVAIIY